ncbi:hypothetical protein [Herbiconiux daphne]|uniref:DUF2188 domain-containing protein n=1 Tax=Herbiconiux daphne TaxID=2970914 RepID=A0ABT2H6G6_9MICO|nr:hypothetical protein [Herbiconiux daphne]MCS5735521.1 hypothetical protein [Herbiconiux daphne]
MARWTFNVDPCNPEDWTDEPENAARIATHAKTAAIYSRAGSTPMHLESVTRYDNGSGQVVFTT